jgi:hypothetical protein
MVLVCCAGAYVLWNGTALRKKLDSWKFLLLAGKKAPLMRSLITVKTMDTAELICWWP